MSRDGGGEGDGHEDRDRGGNADGNGEEGGGERGPGNLRNDSRLRTGDAREGVTLISNE